MFPLLAPVAHGANAASSAVRLALVSPATRTPANASAASPLAVGRSAGATRSRMMPLTEPTLAVTVAVPVPAAATSPAAVTVTTPVFELCHVRETSMGFPA